MQQMPSEEPTYLYLIRHGATEANERRPPILQGRGINGGLSARGLEQAQAVSQFLQEFPLDAVYSSPMRRAVETARAIAEPHNLKVEELDELYECHVGRWEGMDWESIMMEFPEAFRAFFENPGEVPYLEGESYGDVLHRVQPVLQELLVKHAGRRVAVVSHNVVNRVYLGQILGLELGKTRDLRQSNTGVNVIRSQNGKTSVLTMNSIFHLEESSTNFFEKKTDFRTSPKGATQ